MAHIPLLMLLLVATVLPTLARAVYLMDNEDKRIQYSSGWATSAKGDHTYDGTKLYNGTYSYRGCSDYERCSMRIPFTGSGITLYALVEYAFALAISVDEHGPTMHGVDGVSGCCNSLVQPAYNFSFFDVQSLTFGDHSLNITLLNATSGNRASVVLPSQSYLRFDYAAVNQTKASPYFPSSPTATPSVTPSVVTPSVRITVPIGVSIGGIVVVLALVFVAFQVQRRKDRQPSSKIDSGYRTSVTPTIGGGLPYMSSSSEVSAVSQHMSQIPSDIIHPSPTPRALTPHASGIDDTIMGTTPSTVQRPPNDAAASDHFLTPEDVQYIATLYGLSMPAMEVATIMKNLRERREREAASTVDSGSTSSSALRRHPDSELVPDRHPPIHGPRGLSHRHNPTVPTQDLYGVPVLLAQRFANPPR